MAKLGKRIGPWCGAAALAGLALAGLSGAARAEDDAPAAPEDWSVHGQITGVYQGDFGFHSPYQGQNSLSGNAQAHETLSGTAFLGLRLPWSGGEAYFNPEFNQGYGVSRSLGVAGFPNGEAAKAGFDTPKPNVARLFLRQTFGFGGEQETLKPDANQLGETVDVSRLTITAGKFAAPDMFDANAYAHDQRTDFLNLSLWEAGAWDYPADSKGYTDGIAVEFNQKAWAFRWGYFLEPKIANTRDLETRFWKSFGTVAELETRYDLGDAPGILRVLGFLNRAPMGALDQAAQLGGDIEATRRPRYKPGFALNLQQAISDTLGLFSRFSMGDGHTENWAFTDIDRSTTLGLSLKGASWGRADDTIGLAAAVNELSKQHRNYFAAGGLGIYVGDGRLNYAPETILETYYSLQIFKPLSLTLDYQFIADPGYNRDRGPASLFAARAHFEF